MSTKPPTAVMIPSVSSSGFKMILDLLEAIDMGADAGRRRVRWQGKQRSDLAGIGATGIGQFRLGATKLLVKLLVHRFDIGSGQMALARLIVHQGPFGGERPRFPDCSEVGLRALRASGE